MSRKSLKKGAELIGAALFWLLLWIWAYRQVGQDLLLASPAQVGRKLLELLGDRSSWEAIGLSLGRMVFAFSVGVIAGCVLAVLTSAIRPLDVLLRPALAAIRATPVASFIILALVWLRSDRVPVFTGILMVLPILWANVTEGIAATDRNLLEMGRVFGFGRWKTFWKIYLPSVRGTLVAASVASIGLCWKAMIAAEVLGVPRGAIGTRLYNAKIYLETDALFAWTLLIILLSMGLERVFVSAVRRGEARRHGD